VIKSCEPGCGLWLVDTQGKIQQQITNNGTDSYPAWSSDGHYLAFSASERDNNWEIYLLDWANDQLTRLTHRQGTDTTPVFGPCSQEIYLRTDQYGGWWITAMKLDGSDEYKVQEGVGSTSDWGLARPAVR
jgi:TolB protein